VIGTSRSRIFPHSLISIHCFPTAILVVLQIDKPIFEAGKNSFKKKRLKHLKTKLKKASERQGRYYKVIGCLVKELNGVTLVK